VTGLNHEAVSQAKYWLDLAKSSLIEAETRCTKARELLHESGRDAASTAVEMICASVSQLQDDITRWQSLMLKRRESDVDR